MNIVKEIIFVGKAMQKNIQSNSELRFSFWMSVFGMFLNNSAFVIVWYMFGLMAVGMGGWQPIDALGLMGFSAVGYGICFTFFGGIRDLPESVVSGDFDKYFLMPKNILLRLLTSKLITSAVGDILFGLIFIFIWVYFIGMSTKILFISLLFICISTFIHLAFSIVANSFAFYFNNSRPIIQSIFEFFMGPSLFNGGAIQGNMRIFFSYIIPSLVVGTFAVESIRNMDTEKIIISCVICICWLVFSIWFFYRSMRRYESGNFINFG